MANGRSVGRGPFEAPCDSPSGQQCQLRYRHTRYTVCPPTPPVMDPAMVHLACLVNHGGLNHGLNRGLNLLNHGGLSHGLNRDAGGLNRGGLNRGDWCGASWDG